jgi:hypothetical protein
MNQQIPKILAFPRPGRIGASSDQVVADMENSNNNNSNTTSPQGILPLVTVAFPEFQSQPLML